MGTHPYVTKVPNALCKFVVCLAVSIFFFPCAGAQSPQQAPTPSHSSSPAESLYLQLSNVGLDSTRVFKVRDRSIDRPAIHITLEDGTIAFTQDILGKITGAFFEGDGEVLLAPPNEVERKSLSLFTGMAILEERFSTAYFRFNDQTANELQPGLRAPDDAQGFIKRWDETARNLAQVDAMPLLATFSDTGAQMDQTAQTYTVRLQGETYQAALGALSTQLGARLALSQHAQDVTQTVADVTSRVTSAEAAISQLRRLLRHAGSVGGLLTVQNQINAEESGLESLLARQRALAHETSFGTVKLLLVAPSATTQQKKHHAAAGFIGGLKAG